VLVSLWFFVLLVGVAGLALAGFAALEWRRRARRRAGAHIAHGWRLALYRSGGVGLCLALAAASTAEGFNRHYSYIPTFAALFGYVSPDLVHRPSAGTTPPPPDQKPPDHGVVEEISVPGPAAGFEGRRTFVYLPPAYFDGSTPTRRFPVLYLIHGSPGTSVDWLRGGYVDRTMDELLRRAVIDPFIVVLPDVNGGYFRDVECEDVPRGPKAQTYLATDMVGYVDSHYRTLPNRAARAIGGLSTGGYCGLNLTFRHQDVFSAAVSHSGYGKPDRNLYTGDLFGGDKVLEEANTPNYYLPTIPLQLPIGVYLDAGQDDGDSRRGNALLFRMLEPRGVAVTMNIVQGESHTFVAWRRNLLLSLPWLSKWFAAQTVGTGVSTVMPPEAGYLPPPSLSDLGPAPGGSRPCPEASGTRRVRPNSPTTSTTLHGSNKVVGSCSTPAGSRVVRTPTGGTTTTTPGRRHAPATTSTTAAKASTTTTTERPAPSTTATTTTSSP
jgi:enterochelin esterase-like enzyme